ncbi:MAG TPA: ATP-binding protein [Patescibacteria group bacterium]|nr:ATP-binding protein [Patescibacteria group bacterium]
MPADPPNMETALQQSEAKFATVFRACPDLITITQLDSGRYLDVNEAFERITGFSKAEVLGRTALDIGIWETTAERERLLAALAATPHLVDFESRVRRRTGEIFIGLLSAEIAVLDGQRCLIIVGRDISERKRQEELLRLTAAKLERSNIDLERFAHVAAHDLQEPCRTICSYAQLLERQYADLLQGAGQEYLSFLIGGALRMRALIQGLLNYSRLDARAAPFETLPLDPLLDHVLADLEAAIDAAHATIMVSRPLPVVRGDPAQLRQLLVNLVGNAIKFRADARAPRVEVSAHASGGFWRLSVADNGIGIPSEHADSVFEAFRRLHGPESYPGTGIGLAICKRIVEAHGGRIWIDSNGGDGCTVSFTLPMLMDELEMDGK